MAREIKIVRTGNGSFNVRNIPDTLGRSEQVVAARWQQDGEIRAFWESPDAKSFLEEQSGHTNISGNAGIASLETFIQSTW